MSTGSRTSTAAAVTAAPDTSPRAARAGAAPHGTIGPRSWIPVAASILAIAWGGNEFTPLLVLYRDVGHFAPVVVDGLLAAYVLGIVPALLLGGPLSDVLGRRTMLLPAAPLSFIGSGLLAVGADSPLVIGIGRVFCGLALGLVMAIGTAWIKELSDRAGAGSAAGARRASLALTGGFLLGAGVAAALAQFAPFPARATYVVHMLLTLVTGIWLTTAPETRQRPDVAPTFRELLGRLKVPGIAHRRFLRVVVPVAPWVFGAAGTAYAILPALLDTRAGQYPIAFSGLMTVVTLGFGVGIQSVARRIDTRRSARASAIGIGLIAIGVTLAALAAWQVSLALGFVAAAILGCGYGLCLVAGLSEVQRIAGPDDLAGLTAAYYSVAYLGFFIPMILAALSHWVSYPVMLTAGAVIAILTLVEVITAWQAHLPGARRDA